MSPTYSTIEPLVSSQTITAVLFAPMLIAGLPLWPNAGVTIVELIRTWKPLFESWESMQ